MPRSVPLMPKTSILGQISQLLLIFAFCGADSASKPGEDNNNRCKNEDAEKTALMNVIKKAFADKIVDSYEEDGKKKTIDIKLDLGSSTSVNNLRSMLNLECYDGIIPSKLSLKDENLLQFTVKGKFQRSCEATKGSPTYAADAFLNWGDAFKFEVNAKLTVEITPFGNPVVRLFAAKDDKTGKLFKFLEPKKHCQ